jgi:hypothetical protein
MSQFGVPVLDSQFPLYDPRFPERGAFSSRGLAMMTVL